MATLQKKPFVSTGLLRQQHGRPQWLDNWSNPWVLNLNGEVGYGVAEYDNAIYIQYGENAIGWATVRYWAYGLEIVNETVNADNSITAEIVGKPLFWESTTAPSRGQGYVVDYHIRMNNQTVWTYHGRTVDLVSKRDNQEVRITVTIPPETYYEGTLLELSVNYPNGEASGSVSKMGYRLYNPKPKYKPWAVRKGIWRSLTTGWFKKRTNGNWYDNGQINQNKIRKTGSWRNQGKIGQ